jgi:hypothetical protein
MKIMLCGSGSLTFFVIFYYSLIEDFKNYYIFCYDLFYH